MSASVLLENKPRVVSDLAEQPSFSEAAQLNLIPRVAYFQVKYELQESVI